jgi:hypothetical protein
MALCPWGSRREAVRLRTLRFLASQSPTSLCAPCAGGWHVSSRPASQTTTEAAETWALGSALRVLEGGALSAPARRPRLPSCNIFWPPRRTGSAHGQRDGCSSASGGAHSKVRAGSRTRMTHVAPTAGNSTVQMGHLQDRSAGPHGNCWGGVRTVPFNKAVAPHAPPELRGAS